MSDITFANIEAATKAFAASRDALCDVVSALNGAIEDLKRRALPGIRRAVANASETRSALAAMIDAARPLFDRPRTVVMHGIKVGLRKGAGGIEWDDEAKVIARIERLFPGPEADLLIKTTKRIIKSAVQDLDVKTLQSLGCRVVETGDEIVIKPSDSEVDKIVTALLADAIYTEEAP